MTSPEIDPQSTKALSAAAGAAIEEVKGLIQMFLGPVAEELGLAMGESFRIIRLRKQIRALKRAKELLEAEGLDVKSVNLKTFVPLLEASALEDDPGMAERWAALLASAANPKHTALVQPAFVDILKQLSPIQARILEEMYRAIWRINIPTEQWHRRGIIAKQVQTLMGTDTIEFNLAVDNLIRLRLLSLPSTTLEFIDDKEKRFQLSNSEILCATYLGNAFVKACQVKDQGKTPVVSSDTESSAKSADSSAPVWL